MKRALQWPWVNGVLAIVLLSVPLALALPINLDVYVENPIYQCDGVTPLAYGSWIMIIASADNVIDPMETWGGTNLIADSTTGDDVILAIIPTDEWNGPGTFYASVLFDTALYNYIYIRFFAYTNWPISGMICWGTSTIFEVSQFMGYAFVQTDPDGSLYATNMNNFVAIPEPSTANLLVVVGGMIWAIRASARRDGIARARSREGVQGG